MAHSNGETMLARLAVRPLRAILTRGFRLVTALGAGLLVLLALTFVANAAYLNPRIGAGTEAADALQQVHLGMTDQATAVRGYLTAQPQVAPQFLGRYNAGRAETAQSLAVVDRLTQGDRNLSDVVSVMAARSALWQDTYAEPAVSNPTVARAGGESVLARGRALFDSYRQAWAAATDALQDQLEGLLGRQRILLGVGLGASSLLTIALVLVVLRQRRQLVLALVDPIRHLAQVVRRIRDGDLDAADALGHRFGFTVAELAALASDVRDMGRSLAQRDSEARSNQSQLVEAQRLAKVGSFRWQRSAGFTEWSQEMYGIHALDPAAGPPSYEDWLRRVHPDDRDRVARSFEEVGLDGSGREVAYRFTLDGGRERFASTRLECVGGPAAAGLSAHVTGTSQDVTDREVTRQALTDSEARYRLMATHSTDMISRLDDQGRYLYASPAAFTLLGWRPDQLVGHDSFAFIYPEDRAAVRQSRESVRAGRGMPPCLSSRSAAPNSVGPWPPRWGWPTRPTSHLHPRRTGMTARCACSSPRTTRPTSGSPTPC